METSKIILSRSGRKQGKVIATQRKLCTHCKKVHDFFVVKWKHKVTCNCPNIMTTYGDYLKIV